MAAEYEGRTVLVVGAARSGVAAARFLLAEGARVILTDRKEADSLQPAVAPLTADPDFAGRLRLEFGGHEISAFRSCDLVVVSPGVPLCAPFLQESRSAGIPIIAEVELAWRHLEGTVLAITGSNGKTTTTALLSELLQRAGLRSHAAGNIGVPLVTFAGRSHPGDFFCVELSSFQLEGIVQFRPAVAALLNLSADHLDRHPTFASYAAAKERIFVNQRPDDVAVLNADDPLTREIAGRTRSRPVFFSRREAPAHGAFVRADRVLYRDGVRERDLFGVADIRLPGSHNLENVLAAVAVAIEAGVDSGTLRASVARFSGVEHRLEPVAEIDGVRFVNDSKATNVDAAAKAIEALEPGIVLIAGGRDKGGDFTILRPLMERRVRRLILIGEAAGKIREALRGACEMSEAASMAEAVRLAKAAARTGEAVLLAPACASFDMFDNYEHRGRAFKAAVRALQDNQAAGRRRAAAEN